MIFSSKKLEQNIRKLEETITLQNALLSNFITTFKGYTEQLEGYFDKFEKKADESSSWLKTLHEMALKEYTSGPKKRIYAFIYSKKNATEDRLILAARDTFEEAHDSARKSLEGIGENVDADWLMATYKFMDIPQGDPTIVDKAEGVLPAFVKPIDHYINSLNLLRDKFATTVAEKKSVDKLIEKVRKNYL